MLNLGLAAGSALLMLLASFPQPAAAACGDYLEPPASFSEPEFQAGMAQYDARLTAKKRHRAKRVLMDLEPVMSLHMLEASYVRIELEGELGVSFDGQIPKKLWDLVEKMLAFKTLMTGYSDDAVRRFEKDLKAIATTLENLKCPWSTTRAMAGRPLGNFGALIRSDERLPPQIKFWVRGALANAISRMVPGDTAMLPESWLQPFFVLERDGKLLEGYQDASRILERADMLREGLEELLR